MITKFAFMKLSAKLQQDIIARPLMTILPSHNTTTQAKYNALPKAQIGRAIELPKEFDGRKAWKGLLTRVKNQGHCGSCYAFASSSCLADKFNILSEGRMHVELSPTKIILCDFHGQDFSVNHPDSDADTINTLNIDLISSSACHGDTLESAWSYLYRIGTNTEECVPYNKILGSELAFSSLSQFEKDNRLPLCGNVTGPIGDMCYDYSYNLLTGDESGTPARFYRALHYYAVPGVPDIDGGSEEIIKHNIYCWGPVTTGIQIYPSFYDFDAKTDIYEWNGYGDQIGGHAIEILGWGERDNIKYWIVRNSWGPEWGMDGYFYMVRGKNNCQIEQGCVSSFPDFFFPIGYQLPNPDHIVWTELPDEIEQRHEVDTQLKITGGGIDPRTGYTRRIRATKNWVNQTPPINYKNLPDWTSFIAAKVKSVKTSEKHSYFLTIFLIFLAIIVLLILVLIIKNHAKKFYRK